MDGTAWCCTVARLRDERHTHTIWRPGTIEQYLDSPTPDSALSRDSADIPLQCGAAIHEALTAWTGSRGEVRSFESGAGLSQRGVPLVAPSRGYPPSCTSGVQLLPAPLFCSSVHQIDVCSTSPTLPRSPLPLTPQSPSRPPPCALPPFIASSR